MRAAPVALVATGVCLGIASVQASYEPGEIGAAIADLGVGWVLMGCGLVAWDRRRESRAGPLMAATGAAWLLGSLLSPALYLHRGPLVHLLLSYPSGRLAGRRDRVVVMAVYLVAAIEPLAHSPLVTLAVCATVAVTSVGGYLRETGARRRMRAAPAAGATAFALVLALGSVGRLAGWDSAGTTLVAYEIVLATVAAGLLIDLLRGRWTQGTVTGLVVELGEASEPVTLRERIARAVSDPSLQLGYRLGGLPGYVDEAGRPLALPGPDAERVVTPVDRDGERVAVLVHDRAVLDDPALVEAVAAATRIAVTNVRLQSEVVARVEQIAASRRRIVEAADAQRSRLQRELHDGAEQRLAAMSEHLDALSIDVDESRPRQLLGSVEEQLRLARTELGDLARGIRPPALTEGGLAVALPELARRVPIAVVVHVEGDRCRAAIEAAAYFLCAEALTNVAKYARASRASVNVEHDGEQLKIAIADDGVGGADLRRGSGLRGLTDRVEALGGRLSVDSPHGEGTRLVAEIPTG